MSLILNMEDPRVRRTHRLLIESFSELLAQKKYESISVADITRLAHVNRATFYAHFNDKDDLFEEVVYDSFQTMVEEVEQVSDRLDELMIRQMSSSMYTYLDNVRSRCSHYNEATKLLVEHKLKIALSEFIYSQLRQNAREDVSENILKINAAMVGNAICGATCIGYNSGIEAVTDEICDMIIPKINRLVNR